MIVIFTISSKLQKLIVRGLIMRMSFVLLIKQILVTLFSYRLTVHLASILTVKLLMNIALPEFIKEIFEYWCHSSSKMDTSKIT
jgi:hypothetical protein